MKPQFIERNGKAEYAIVPIREYERLLRLAEDNEDRGEAEAILAHIEAGDEETFSDDFAARLIAGENRIRLWREHRGLSVEALAEAAGVSRSRISQLENDMGDPSLSLLKRLGEALRCDIGDLAQT
jgi:DNA-binding XRE family transcriptional regulator